MKTILLLKSNGLALNHGHILAILHRTPGLRASQVGLEFGDASQTMVSQLLVLLQRRKLLRYEYIEVDTKSVQAYKHYYLTEKGKTIADQFSYETPVPH